MEPKYVAALKALRDATWVAAWHVHECRVNELVSLPDAQRTLAAFMACVVHLENHLDLRPEVLPSVEGVAL